MSLDLFIEQAEYIQESLFTKWTVKHHDESNIIRKLSHGGAKLITGPRGCGKTTLMLKTYNKSMTSRTSKHLSVYVNFKSSLKLEPLYKKYSNADFWFNQWILYKILQGLFKSLGDLKCSSFFIKFKPMQVDKNVNLIEMGRVDLIDQEDDLLTVSYLIEILNKAITETNNSRCVLLLDDAGHAFSPDQQQDFFEFFREIRTKSISPKAAVYPGVTSYSTSFHIGHDAEEIDVWIKPSTPGYLQFMYSILKSRFDKNTYSILSQDENILNLICYAAYGIPRSLLNIISSLNEEDHNSSKKFIFKKLKSTEVLRSIKKDFDKTYQLYDSLKLKLPMYKNFIDSGSTFFESCLTIIKEFNKSGTVKRQSTIIAIKRPLSPELTKVLGFFQYTGLVSPQGIASRGDKGVFELFELHYAAIIERNVFFSKRAVNIEEYCTAFSNRLSHTYPRRSEQKILGSDEVSNIFVLALPSCEICNTPRISEKAKFCAHCGNKLADASIFENIVNQDVNKLPITLKRASSIKENCKIRTIKDILMDHENRELRNVPMIGPFWSNRIKSYAEEFIA